MGYSEELVQFIQVLSSSENSNEVSDQAFSIFEKRYHIARVSVEFVTPENVFLRSGDRRHVIIYESPVCPEYEQPAHFHGQFHTGEGGTVDFYLFCPTGTAAYSEDELRELQTVFDVFLFHCGRWRMIDRVKKLIMTDSLTGLPNSGGFLTYADELLQQKELIHYNAFYLNLSCFSLVNKRFGADETDTILIRYAKELKSFTKGGECVGRLGGDNFVALIYKERTDEFLKLISGVDTYGMLGGQRIPIKIAAVAGVYEVDERTMHSGMVIGECSTALDIARHMQKRPYVYASDEIRMQMFKERQVVGNFSEAMKKGAFKTYYQPKVEIDTDTYRIVGAEALARLIYDGKAVPPIEFVPILEKNGLICTLDFYMLEQVCKDIRRWLAMGINPGRISINLSRKNLANPRLAEDIIAVLDKYEVERTFIELELTESAEESEASQIIDFMKKMKEHDVSLSIDDFGTGYSSLNLLRFFPVDVLKLDRTFLCNIEANDRIVLSNIIRMATELHMDVVAEGVETWEQVEYLKQIHCNVVQGFLFDKPIPKEEFEQKLKLGGYEKKITYDAEM